jgi:RsiW-degrading membrane proteinase PrsW (M82 family)
MEGAAIGSINLGLLPGLHELTVEMVAAVTLAFAIPLSVLFLVHLLDRYDTELGLETALCCLWGAVAVALAYQVNSYLVESGTLQLEVQRVVGAPIVEELLKALPLFLLLHRGRMTYLVDGAIYGFASGTGFAVAETLVYLQQHGWPLELSIARSCSTALLHASATAMVGLGLGKLRFEKRGERARGLPIVLALVLAAARSGAVRMVALRAALIRHAGFNTLVGHPSTYVVLLAVLFGLGSVGIVVFLIRRGIQQERRWIQETLAGAAVDEDERRLINDLPGLHANLSSIAHRFGEEKRHLLEHMLHLEARAGLARKVLSVADAREQGHLSAELQNLEDGVSALRRQVGSACLAYFHRLSWDVLHTHRHP